MLVLVALAFSSPCWLAVVVALDDDWTDDDCWLAVSVLSALVDRALLLLLVVVVVPEKVVEVPAPALLLVAKPAVPSP